jgi:hypothetical protein
MMLCILYSSVGPVQIAMLISCDRKISLID